jgi:type I site-specific restriction endonuclease
VEVIAKDQDRVLLGMAIGTDKTHSACRIFGRLWTAARKEWILFLAGHTDHTMVNDFRPFCQRWRS